MKTLPAADPRSWRFQANIHGTLDPIVNPLFNQCEHGTLLFLAWHRGYLYYFERILRAASGDPNLTLPYWNWTANPSIPSAFLDPPSAGNPLYDDSRLLNDGSALPPEVVVDDLSKALACTTFPPTPGIGFSPSLEDSPHGNVHSLVGGKMGSVPTAANDPIFWLHHGNIDRTWDRWLNMGGGRSNPSDPTFLDKTYSFVDEFGNVVAAAVRDVLSSARLGYRYDDSPSPLPSIAALLRPQAGVPATQKAKPKLAASSATESQTSAAKPLGLRPVTIPLHVPPSNRAAVGAAGQGEGASVLLEIQGIEFTQPPTFTYAVYLNLPQDDLPSEQARRYYVGSVNFFGREGGVGHAHRRTRSFDQVLDATTVVSALKKSGRWNPETIKVTLRPLTAIAPPDQEQTARQRVAAAAQQAQVRYRSVHLLLQP